MAPPGNQAANSEDELHPTAWGVPHLLKILSLLLDHCLLLHPEQTARLENKQPACTVGSLCEKSRVQALLAFIRRVLDEDNPQDKLRQLADQLEHIFPLRDSTKHMNGRDLGRIGPTPSLRYQAVQA